MILKYSGSPQNGKDSGSALIMVVILSAIIYLAITLLLLMTTVETHVSFFEQRSMQALFGAESALTLGIADLRANNGQPITINNELVTFADDVIAFSSNTSGTMEDAPLYSHVMLGSASISGASGNGSAVRSIAEHVMVKPFTLFASEELALTGNVSIAGHASDIGSNIHGGQRVRLDRGVSVAGNVTFGTSLECQNQQIGAKNSIICPNNTISGKIQRESGINLPNISEKAYLPKYMYQGKIYEAEALDSYETVALVPKEGEGGEEPPAQAIHLYVERPSDTNPAGVFFADATINDEAMKTLTNFDIQGTLILRGAGEWNIKGIVKIEAVEQFPAILKFSDEPCSLAYFPYENIEAFFADGDHGMNRTSRISGLIYSAGDVTLVSDGVGGELVNGSVFAENITISGVPQFSMRYNLRVLTDSPPGLQLIERSNWREKIGSE